MILKHNMYSLSLDCGRKQGNQKKDQRENKKNPSQASDQKGGQPPMGFIAIATSIV